MTLFTKWEPDLAGQILHTGYLHFETCIGVEGLAKESENGACIEVLSVICAHQGAGLFRRFVAELKTRYQTICMWEDWNPIVGPALERYGFTRQIEILGDGEVIEGWRWDAPQK